MLQIPAEFEQMRSYEDNEVQQAIDSLLNDRAFKKIIKGMLKVSPIWFLKAYTKNIKSIHEFQIKLVYPFVRFLKNHKTDGLSSNISSLPEGREDFLFLSNHRDIVLDSAFLDFLLVSNKRKTVEIGIGNNLLIYPWIKTLVRLNRSFIVNRSASRNELMQSSQQLSDYIRFVIEGKKSSLWLAQREGRAKDSNDRTQSSVLKMLLMSGEGTIAEKIKSLHITPLTISYEFDPCDYLKAEEFQQKRDNPAYRKSKQADLTNMKVGIFGYKGRVHYEVMPELATELDSIDNTLNRNQYLEQLTAIIDNKIFGGYRIYPCNYIALDMLNGNNNMCNNYTAKDKKRFEKYLKGQLAKISIENPDYDFLRCKILEMYANPLINKLSTLNNE